MTTTIAVQATKSAIVVMALLVGFRLFGKRETGQLNVYDLAMLFALANAVQNAMTAGKGELSIGLAASTAVVATGWALSRLLFRRPSVERWVVGSPTIIVHDGHVLRDRMRRERVSDDELQAAVREFGLDDVGAVDLAVLEVDGSISIVPRKGSQ